MLEARIEKRYAGFTLKVDINAENETLALLGANGAGKTMTLKCIAGIIKPDRGYIAVDGKVWFDSQRHIDIKPQERGVGLLFQQYALFPNMTVRQNLLCGLRHDTQKQDRSNEVDRLIDTFCLQGLASQSVIWWATTTRSPGTVPCSQTTAAAAGRTFRGLGCTSALAVDAIADEHPCYF